ncbi:hypothetical protein FPRO04_14380 [Fusarium proliferatum]|nr:hypothetical protein FPRO04_14380 [Fusarium proliferatum]
MAFCAGEYCSQLEGPPSLSSWGRKRVFFSKLAIAPSQLESKDFQTVSLSPEWKGDPRIFQQTAAVADGAPAPPKLIIIASWTNALDGHIAKYVNKYKELYPTSQLLLIKSTNKTLFNPPLLAKAVQPAIPVIWASFQNDASSRSQPVLLIHLLSNGGSSSVSALYNQYASLARDSEDPYLPLHMIIFDSAPGAFTVSGTISFFQVGLPTAALNLLGFTRDWLTYWGKTHNETEGNKEREVRHMCIYSDEDALVGHDAVETNAAEAEKLGFQVRRQKFNGSLHVSHARKDEARYWGAVKST